MLGLLAVSIHLELHETYEALALKLYRYFLWKQWKQWCSISYFPLIRSFKFWHLVILFHFLTVMWVLCIMICFLLCCFVYWDALNLSISSKIFNLFWWILPLEVWIITLWIYLVFCRWYNQIWCIILDVCVTVSSGSVSLLIPSTFYTVWINTTCFCYGHADVWRYKNYEHLWQSQSRKDNSLYVFIDTTDINTQISDYCACYMNNLKQNCPI